MQAKTNQSKVFVANAKRFIYQLLNAVGSPIVNLVLMTLVVGVVTAVFANLGYWYFSGGLVSWLGEWMAWLCAKRDVCELAEFQTTFSVGLTLAAGVTIMFIQLYFGDYDDGDNPKQTPEKP